MSDSGFFDMKEEAYVNDIPFDTWMISKEVYPEELNFKLSEENYVDDIPFSTEKIFNGIQMEQLTERWKNEPNVSDMPFDLCCSSDGMLIMLKRIPLHLNEFNVIIRNPDRLLNMYPF